MNAQRDTREIKRPVGAGRPGMTLFTTCASGEMEGNAPILFKHRVRPVTGQGEPM